MEKIERIAKTGRNYQVLIFFRESESYISVQFTEALLKKLTFQLKLQTSERKIMIQFAQFKRATLLAMTGWILSGKALLYFLHLLRYDAVSTDVMISVPKLDDSESGQMVLEKVK